MLKRKRNAAANRTRRLHQVDCAAILAHDGNVSLSQKVADVNHGVHVAGQEPGSGDGLPQEEC